MLFRLHSIQHPYLSKNKKVRNVDKVQYRHGHDHWYVENVDIDFHLQIKIKTSTVIHIVYYQSVFELSRLSYHCWWSFTTTWL